MGAGDIILLIGIIAGLVIFGLYFLNRWASKKMGDQQSIIERTKAPATIYVIDKKKEKATNANLPKSIVDQLPKTARFMKMPLVKAKIGPQIMTLMCDQKVFDALPVKKTVKVEIAGIYIVGMKGMKTKKEMQELRESRKAKSGTADETPKKWYEKVNPKNLLKKS